MLTDTTLQAQAAPVAVHRRQCIDRRGRSAVLFLDVTMANGRTIHLERSVERFDMCDEEPLPPAAWLPYLDRLTARMVAEAGA